MATQQIKVAKRIKEILADQLGLRVEEIKDENHFIDDLGADSLDIVELIMAMEEEFDLQIPDEDAEKMLRVHDAINYVLEKSS